jgi:hypothetical protein
MNSTEKALVSEARGFLARAIERLTSEEPPNVAGAVSDINAGDDKLQTACPTCDPTEPPE